MSLFHACCWKLSNICGIRWFIKSSALSRDSLRSFPWKVPCTIFTFPDGCGSTNSLPAAGVMIHLRLANCWYQAALKVQVKTASTFSACSRKLDSLAWTTRVSPGSARRRISKSTSLKSNARTSFQRQVCSSTFSADY